MSILVFDKGEKVFLLKIEDLDPRNGAIVQVLTVNIDGVEIDVMYMFDMDYGIVIDKGMADSLRGCK